MQVLVTGAGGFIGGHLVGSLLKQNHDVRAVDQKQQRSWFQLHDGAENVAADLMDRNACDIATRGVDRVYHLAADMGGMGFIENNKAACMLSSLITSHLLLASRDNDVARLFYSSSACVYAAHQQLDPEVTALREGDAYPAQPEDGYGWEKLFGERMCRHFTEDFDLDTRVARYHNVYGPYGTWTGGREKAPAAICRKVLEAKRTGRPEIEVWGDGLQTRSFMYIEDCIEGTLRLMDAEYAYPVNVGSAELVSINDLTELVAKLAGVHILKRHDLSAPQGVRGRNSDNTLVRRVLDWEPSTPLEEGMATTLTWIDRQMSGLDLRQPVAPTAR